MVFREGKSLNGQMSGHYRQYVSGLERQLSDLYAISNIARQKGLDPAPTVECRTARDLADLVEGLVGPKGVAESIRDLNDKLPREELAFKITEQIVYGKFEHLEPEAAANQAIRTALAIFTEGLTAAPLQGIAKVSVKVNHDRTSYLAVYFAGPMRSAGGTDQALTLVVADFVRRLIGLDRYKPTEEEISRFIEEIRLYERSVTRFQYHVPDDQLRNALQCIPVEVTGTESNPIEVSSYRNLPRIETNRVRGGALRVVNDGIVGRASKVFAIIEKLGFQGWDWLKDVRTRTEKKSAGFMDDVIAGRPVFAFPSRKGGFRLRYGRARNTGLAAVGIHPATMLTLQNFLAGGTQVRLELPGKGGVVSPVDSIETPIVKLKDDSVVKVTMDNFGSIKSQIKKILFLGDILISLGDFLYNNKPLAPSGYVEEWWVHDVNAAIVSKFLGDSGKASEAAEISLGKLQAILKDPLNQRPTANEAIRLSQSLDVPLHPIYTHFWSNLLSVNQIIELRTWLLASDIQSEGAFSKRIIGIYDQSVKQLLETICIPHRNQDGKIVVEEPEASILALCLGLGRESELDLSSAKSPLEAVRFICGLRVENKAATFVGARMGRPEKAKRRAMKPLVHVLFPVGLAGGPQRDIVEAAKGKPVYVEIVKRRCPNCGISTIRTKCQLCGSETVLEKCCPQCGKILTHDICPVCKAHARSFQKQTVNFNELVNRACSNASISLPKILKGVKGLTNESKTPETIEKGILRAKYDLSVYKDGTIRFDSTNVPLTHFKPREIGVSVARLRELGYYYASDGSELTDDSQMCELKLQDVIIPRECGKYFVRVSKFLDELLVRIYGMPSFYNVNVPLDLVGHVIFGLAPHTCAAIVGRIIGFTSLSLCYAHPVWHSAKRRDCDGDEDAVMLGLDSLLNFSREFLPAQIGGIMDAPLLLIPIVVTQDVQRQAHDFDVANAYPLEFYQKTTEKVYSRQVTSFVDLIGTRLGTEAQFEGFNYTAPTFDINTGNEQSVYKQFKTMVDKLSGQLSLAEKIEAVDARRVALKVLTTHFIRDIAGNLRAFSTQAFRCKSCNKRYRRLPLKGKCPLCGGQLSLTVYRGGIEKYLDAAQSLVDKYALPHYYAQRMIMLKEEIDALFSSKKTRQISLADFA